MENQVKVPTLIQKVSETEVKKDKNGKNYKTVYFSKIAKQLVHHPLLGDVVVDVPAKPSGINVYEASYLDESKQFGYDLAIGQYAMGDIVTKTVPEYEITSKTGEVRTVNTYTTVVFGDDTKDNWNNVVKQAFLSKGHSIEYVEVVKAIEATPFAELQEESADLLSF